MTGIVGAQALEEACGERYRREVVDLGVGFGRDNMRMRLRVWGYDVSGEACRNWLRSYQPASSLKEGNCGVYALSRQDLRKWYYVDKLTPTRLQDKYRDEHGVFAHRNNLIQWLDAPAQMPERLENNESIHSHASGEFVLDLLQRGMRPEAVVEELMREYVVVASVQRVVAYRRHREQRGD